MDCVLVWTLVFARFELLSDWIRKGTTVTGWSSKPLTQSGTINWRQISVQGGSAQRQNILAKELRTLIWAKALRGKWPWVRSLSLSTWVLPLWCKCRGQSLHTLMMPSGRVAVAEKNSYYYLVVSLQWWDSSNLCRSQDNKQNPLSKAWLEHWF